MLKKFQQLLFAVILLSITFQGMAQHTLPDKVCIGTERNYKVTGLPTSVFTWKINGVTQASTDDNIDITWTNEGIYTLELQEHTDHCSSEIKSGTVTVLPVPIQPVSTGNIIAMVLDPVQTLDARNSIAPIDGITIVWYDADGAVVANPTLNAVGTVTYYAEASNDICSSPTRTPVVLTILPEIITPTVAALITSDTTPGLTGTATVNAGDVFTVTVNGITYTLGDGNLTLAGNTWSLQIPADKALADNTYAVTATVKDAADNNSTDVTTNELVVDTTAPLVPTVASLSTNDNTPIITGTVTVNAGDQFTVTVNGITYSLGDGNLTLVGNNWSLQIPAGSELTDNTYEVTATVKDAADNSSTDVSTNELLIDTTAPLVPTVVSLFTNDNTPIITGTATVNADDQFTVTVNGITYTLGDGNLSIDGNYWSLQIPAANALADNTYEVTATVTDALGNSSDDVTTNELLIDTTAPLVPTVTALSTNDNTPIITGTATVNAGDQFTVTVNGITYSLGDGNLTLVGNNWSLQIPAGSELADGTYSVTATVKDALGNSSDDVTTNELLIDTIAPLVPTVNALSTNDNTPIITGTATVNAGNQLTVTVNGIFYTLGDGNLSIDGNNWSLQIPAGSELADGTYSVTATLTDASGNSSDDITNNELIIDTTAPLVPTVVSLFTNDNTPIITGTATVNADDQFTVTVNGITYTLGDGNLSIDGNNWSLQIPAASALADNTYEVTATVKDAANNISTDVSTNELIINTTAPLAPTVTALSTNDHTPAITGTATVNAGDVFKVTVNGVTYTLGDGNLSIDGNNWTLQIPAGSELADGTYSVTATVKDAFNNSSSDITANELVIDTTAPLAPTVNSLSTNNHTPVITGTATVNAGDVFKVTVNGVTYTLGDGNLSIDGNNWTLQIPAGSELADGTYSVTATVKDAVNNSSSDVTANELVIDTTAPLTPTVNSLSTNNHTPVITGTATVNAGDVFKVTVNGVTYTLGDGNLSIDGNNWTLQIPAGSELADGTYSVTATVKDAVNNSSSDATANELVIDTTAPLAPTVTTLSTNDHTPVITGTATIGVGETFKVTVNGITYTLGDGNLSIDGNNWTLRIPAGSELADGTYSVTATVKDAVNNSSSDVTANELLIDTTAPLAPTVVALSTNDHTPVITGTATVGVGETFTVIVNGITYTLGDGNLSIDGNNWTLQIPAGSELADGTYSVTATVKDAANNSSSDVTANELVIDTTAPLAPTVVALSTNDHTPVITGTATVGVGETFTVTVNGISYTLGDGNLSIDGNNWTLQIPAESELADGTYSVTATVKDAANNSSADITANELVIDTTAPEVPTVNVLKSNDSTPAITGTATVNAGDVFTVTVNGITYILGDGNLSMNGNNWTLQIPAADALTDGTYSVTATVMDAIGNLSNDITTNEVEIKTTAPEVPTVNVLKSNDSTPAITGTATVNAGDVFTVTVNGITYTLGDGNLILKINNWTLQIPSERELANGIYSVTAVVTDAFGNSSEDQTKDELTIKNSKAPLAIILGSPLRMLGRCSTDLQLDASASSGDGLIYQWTPSIYLDNPSSSKPKFHPGSTTRYLLTVTDSEGQTDTASVRIVIADAPKAVTDKNVFVNTPEANIVLNGSPSTGVGLTYQWSAKEGHVLTGENQPAATVNGLGTYYLQVKDSYGCTSRDSVTVGLYVQAMSDTTEITVNESVTINVLRNDLPHGALDPSSITIVTPPSHGVASMAADSLIIYQPETSYTGQDEFVYQVCDYAGLCDNATVLVLVNDLPLFIPEAFSPNGDAINDRFVIKGLEKYTRVEIEIFNRWGNIVYQSPNYGEGEGRDGYWNGMASSGLRIESGPVPSGTYYFILKMNGQKNISGSLYLDR